MLLDAVDLDQLNDDGHTPMQSYLDRMVRPDANLYAIIKSYYPYSLSFFSVQVIVRNKIPFNELPKDLLKI